MVYYLFAMQREADQINIENKILVGINAIELPQTTEDDILVNIGYCGATADIPVGTIVEPSEAYDAVTGDKVMIDKLFGCEDIKCFTANEFVTEPIEENRNIYDMELYKLAKLLPHKKIYSLKIVSDNLNENDCEQYNDQAAWAKIKDILEKFKHEII
jgi:hypothetical protein